MNFFACFFGEKSQDDFQEPTPYITREPESKTTMLDYETEVMSRHMKAKTGRPHFTGRGGRGNMAGPTYRRQSSDSIIQNDREIISQHLEAKAEKPYSFGRAGLGNITSYQQPGISDQNQAADLEYEKKIIGRHRDAAADKPYLCGRGGLGNVASSIRHNPTKCIENTSPLVIPEERAVPSNR